MIAVPHSSGDSLVFLTDADAVSIGPGSEVAVGITALEPGETANGAFGTADMIDPVAGVTSIVASAIGGGTDEETDAEYLDRLRSLLTLMAPRPILPGDFALMAESVPGVGRAAAFDLYQAGTDDDPVAASTIGGSSSPIAAGPGVDDVERAVTVVVTGEDGAPPSLGLMRAVYNDLDARREVNFLIYVIAPGEAGVYTGVDVRADVHVLPGYDWATVVDNIEASLGEWLNPASWGVDVGALSSPWAVDTKARLYEAVEWMNRAQGVHWVENVELKRSTQLVGDFAAADLTLPGKAPMPTFGAATLTQV